LIKQTKILSLILIAGFITSMGIKASNGASKIRDIKSKTVSIQNKNSDNPEQDAESIRRYASTNGNTVSVKGGVSVIYSIVGKSQVIRFDEPVKRISIANPGLADLVLLSKKELLLNGKAPGVTSFIVWGNTGDPVFFDLNVKTDSNAFMQELKKIAPDEDIDITFTNVTGGGGNGAATGEQQAGQAAAATGQGGGGGLNVVVSGKISTSITRDRIKALSSAFGFNMIDLTESPTPQVLLSVKFVEASRTLTRNMYAQTANAYVPADVRDIKFFVNPFKGSGMFANIQAIDTVNASRTGGNLASIAATSLGLGPFKLPLFNTTTSLAFEENKGLVRTLAEPKLMALNKQQGSFNAGQEIPVPQGIDPQTGLINYGYKNVGVNLVFTPDIMLDSKKIRLQLQPEVSEIDSSISVNQGNGITIYGIKTRKTQTNVELNDGDTLVIAGLFQKNDNVTTEQVPFLGDLPIIGNLFASKEFRKGETELLIFITPKIILPDSNSNGV